MKNRNGRSSPAPVDPARLEELARTAFDGWLIVDDARRYVHVNEPAAELLGAPVHEILKRRMDDFTPPEKQGVLDRAWTELEQQGTLYGKGETVRGDGSRSLVESRAVWNVAPGQHLIFMRGVPQAPHEAAVNGTEVEDNPRLTARERQVVQLAAGGRSTREIAEILFLSPGTVKTHFQHVYDKLGARSRGAAIAECLRRGLID